MVQLLLKVDIAIAYYSQTQYHGLQKATTITAKHPSSTNQQCPFGKNRGAGLAIYHHLPAAKMAVSNPSIKPPMGIWDIYGQPYSWIIHISTTDSPQILHR